MREQNNLYKALQEVSVVLQYTDPTLRAKVPKNFTWFMENFKDESHYFRVDLRKPMQEQNLMYESMVILSLIMRSAWCDKKTIKRLEKVYKVGEAEFMHDRMLKEQQLTREINALTVIKKDNIFKRFLKGIKRMFGFNKSRLYIPD